jgi:hypothetical protein
MLNAPRMKLSVFFFIFTTSYGSVLASSGAKLSILINTISINYFMKANQTPTKP